MMRAIDLQSSVNLIPWRMRGWIKHIPIIAGLQRLYFRRFLSGREFLHEINAGAAKGLIYPISLPLDKAIWAGTYESDLAKAIAAAVNRGDVCYDVGAYRGFFSGVFALAGAGEVIAFEPVPENFAQLQRLAANNPQLPLRLEPVALGREEGLAEFNVMPDSSMGKLAVSTFQTDALRASVLQVLLRTVDGLIAESAYLPPQIIKIDVEGAEADVLHGAMKTLQTNRPILFIEAHSEALAKNCTSFLEGLAYRVRVFENDRAHAGGAGICHLVATPESNNGI
jgi:FkbM family methyltransferase